VLLRGRLVGEFDPHTVTPQELGSAMTGAGAEPNPDWRPPKDSRPPQHGAGGLDAVDFGPGDAG
jgi:hypothetical protein